MSNSLGADFREVMSGVAGPVVVVTTLADGLPYGTTVSSFASLSLEPPMIMVALDRGSDLLATLRPTERFGVNVLGSGQSALALAFARKGGTGKFDGVAWHLDDELPRLPAVPGWLSCELDNLVEGGDHLLALGVVHRAEAAVGPPLTYHARQFGTHTLLELDD